jgi:hypothetical protein
MIDTSTTLLRALCKACLGLTTGLTTTYRIVRSVSSDNFASFFPALQQLYRATSRAVSHPRASPVPAAATPPKQPSCLFSYPPLLFIKATYSKLTRIHFYPLDPVSLASPNLKRCARLPNSKHSSSIPYTRTPRPASSKLKCYSHPMLPQSSYSHCYPSCFSLHAIPQSAPCVCHGPATIHSCCFL